MGLAHFISSSVIKLGNKTRKLVLKIYSREVFEGHLNILLFLASWNGKCGTLQRVDNRSAMGAFRSLVSR